MILKMNLKQKILISHFYFQLTKNESSLTMANPNLVHFLKGVSRFPYGMLPTKSTTKNMKPI